ncbi:MFS transporter [Streptomyces sp. MRC013]|uniref:MFS transporter n=1 Tax=Streptomyces sp. MRC013 TaxID=2898276 RepID=UPI002026FA86|nr:MFS transporter [Streptomyces sp. MRC013]URM88720.1 MFS transporter [Streptomyces sp. MRC013]
MSAERRAPVQDPPRGPLHGYRELRRIPGFWRIFSVGMASKLPNSMVELSLLLLVSRTYSYGVAGLAVAFLAVGQGVTAPLRGRLADRHSPRTVLLCCLAGYLVATALVVLAVSRQHSVAVVLTASAALGAASPPVAP